MSHVISKAINTATSRLKVGHPVTGGDDLAPHSFDDLLARGFIKSAPVFSVPAASLSPAVAVKATV